MNNTFNLKTKITSSLVDYDNKMRFDTLLNEFQNATIFHSEEMGVGFEDFKKSSNAFWVLTKIKLYAPKMPKIYENVDFITYPTDISGFRFIREFTALGDMGAKVLGHSEWCVLDLETKRLRRSDSVVYPFNEIRRTDNVGLEFSNMKFDVVESDYSYDYTVKLIDIDCNNHTNNVSYAKMALNAFDIEEYKSYNFTTFEIKFINQSYFGDKITIYKKQVDNGVYILGKILDKQIFSVMLSK